MRKARIVTTERIKFSVRPDHVSAAAIDAVFIPGPGVHERLDEKTEGVSFVEFKLLEQFAQRFGFATAAHEVFQFVTDFVAEKTLHGFEINEVADGAHVAVYFQQV